MSPSNRGVRGGARIYLRSYEGEPESMLQEPESMLSCENKVSTCPWTLDFGLDNFMVWCFEDETRPGVQQCQAQGLVLG